MKKLGEKKKRRVKRGLSFVLAVLLLLGGTTELVYGYKEESVSEVAEAGLSEVAADVEGDLLGCTVNSEETSSEPAVETKEAWVGFAEDYRIYILGRQEGVILEANEAAPVKAEDQGAITYFLTNEEGLEELLTVLVAQALQENSRGEDETEEGEAEEGEAEEDEKEEEEEEEGEMEEEDTEMTAASYMETLHLDGEYWNVEMLQGEQYGVEYDSATGFLSVTNYEILASCLESATEGQVRLFMVCYKEAYLYIEENSESEEKSEQTEVFFAADFAVCEIAIEFAENPAEDLAIEEPTGENGWYTEAVTVTAPVGYVLATSPEGIFAEEMTIEQQGEFSVKLYLKQVETGEICAPVMVEGKLDSQEPTELGITFSTETLIQEKVGLLWVFQPTVTVMLTAKDATSGIDKLEWAYQKSSDAGSLNLEFVSGTVSQFSYVSSDTVMASICLPFELGAQLDGILCFRATDQAGNVTDYVSSPRFLVDSISPESRVSYPEPVQQVEGVYYYKEAQEITVTIAEANFDPEEVEITLWYAEAVTEWQILGEPLSMTEKEVNLVWNETETEGEYETVFSLEAQGVYLLQLNYTDWAGNAMEEYRSPLFVVDWSGPEFTVVLPEPISEREEGWYYGNEIEVEIYLEELNFSAEDTEILVEKKVESSWILVPEALVWCAWSDPEKSAGVYQNELVAVLRLEEDGCYRIRLSGTDLSKNRGQEYRSALLIVDTQTPDLEVFYENCVETEPRAGDVGVVEYFDEAVEVSLRIEEVNFFSQDVTVTLWKAVSLQDLFTAEVVQKLLAGEMSLTGEENDSGKTGGIEETSSFAGIGETVEKVIVKPEWQEEEITAEASFSLTEDGAYFFCILYTDPAGNVMETYLSSLLVVDTLEPEANFLINGITREEDGGVYGRELSVSFSLEDLNLKETQVTLESFTYRDLMQGITSDTGERTYSLLWKIGTKNQKLTFVDFGTEEASSGEELFGEESTGEEEIAGIWEKLPLTLQLEETFCTGTFCINPGTETDGNYRLRLTATDRAGHKITREYTFVVNGYGSVYVYSDYVVSLIEKGGGYFKIQEGQAEAITRDLVIWEYCPSTLTEGTLQALITRDGELVEGQVAIEEVTENKESLWNCYQYTISKENFSEDGTYRITLLSTYATLEQEENQTASVPTNSFNEAGEELIDSLLFTVDTTPPTIRSIMNLEEKIINAATLEISYTLVDAGGLASVEIYINDCCLESVTDFGENSYYYRGSFTLTEAEEEQTIRLVVRDLAGNVTDTAKAGFSGSELFVWKDTVLLSTSGWVRFFARRAMCYGVLAGGAFLVILAVGVVLILKKEKVHRR